MYNSNISISRIIYTSVLNEILKCGLHHHQKDISLHNCIYIHELLLCKKDDDLDILFLCGVKWKLFANGINYIYNNMYMDKWAL